MGAGEPYEAFWTLTAAEIVAVVNARRTAKDRDHDAARAIAYEQARLIAFAFHQPQDIPEFKPMSAPEKASEPSAADYEMARGYFMGLALKPKGAT